MDSMPGQNLDSTNQQGGARAPPLLNQKGYDNEKENSEPETSKCRAYDFRDGRMGMVYCDSVLRTDRCVIREWPRKRPFFCRIGANRIMIERARGQAELTSSASNFIYRIYQGRKLASSQAPRIFIYRIYQGRKLSSLRSMGSKNSQRAAQNAAQKSRNRRTKNYTNGAENC